MRELPPTCAVLLVHVLGVNTIARAGGVRRGTIWDQLVAAEPAEKELHERMPEPMASGDGAGAPAARLRLLVLGQRGLVVGIYKLGAKTRNHTL